MKLRFLNEEIEVDSIYHDVNFKHIRIVFPFDLNHISIWERYNYDEAFHYIEDVTGMRDKSEAEIQKIIDDNTVEILKELMNYHNYEIKAVESLLIKSRNNYKETLKTYSKELMLL